MRRFEYRAGEDQGEGKGNPRYAAFSALRDKTLSLHYIFQYDKKKKALDEWKKKLDSAKTCEDLKRPHSDEPEDGGAGADAAGADAAGGDGADGAGADGAKGKAAKGKKGAAAAAADGADAAADDAAGAKAGKGKAKAGAGAAKAKKGKAAAADDAAAAD